MTSAPFPQYNRFAIRAALDQGGIKLRDWQRDALIRATAADCPDAALIVAIMGAGKSIRLSQLALSCFRQEIGLSFRIAIYLRSA